MISRKTFVTLLCLLASTIPATATASIDKTWNFTVYLDDKEIGYHRFDLDREGDTEKMTIQARFKYRLFGIPLYSYTHDNRETRQGHCLRGITAMTDDNGREFRVEGKAGSDGFSLQTLDDKQLLPDCISTFAYWDKSFLDSPRLLNAQNGEYLDVSSSFEGTEMLDVGNERVPALRYRLLNEKFRIDIWYSENDEWLGLQSTTQGGRILRYVIE